MSEPYTVVWSGASRQYLAAILPPPPTPFPIERQPDPAPGRTAWLRGEHLKETDLPRLRLTASLHAAPSPFTVHDLAEAARVSPSRARNCLWELERRGEVRPVGKRPTGTTHAVLFVWVRPRPEPELQSAP